MPSRPFVPALSLQFDGKHSSYAFVGPFTATPQQNQSEYGQDIDLRDEASDVDTVYESEASTYDLHEAELEDSDFDWSSESALDTPHNSCDPEALSLLVTEQEAELWDWKELRLEDECNLRPYFANSLIWISSYEAYFTDLVHRPCPASYIIVDELLLIRRWEESTDGRGNWLLLPPLFKTLPEKLEHISKVMRLALDNLPGSCFNAVSEKYLALIEPHLSNQGLAAKASDPGEWDYIYPSKDLIALDSSSSLKEKRRRARTFATRYSPKVISLAPDNWSDALLQRCLQVAERWVEENGVKVGSLNEDSECLRDHMFTLNLLTHFAKHPNMRGVLVEIEDQPVALALVELEAAGKVVLSHVEKSLVKAVPEAAFSRGIYPFTLRAYLEQWKDEGIETVNRESDDGIPGLRESKNLYKPVEWRKKFTITEIKE